MEEMWALSVAVLRAGNEGLWTTARARESQHGLALLPSALTRVSTRGAA